MSKSEYNEEQISEMIVDAFVNIKEACVRLQERSNCCKDVVIKILDAVSKFYLILDMKNKT